MLRVQKDGYIVYQRVTQTLIYSVPKCIGSIEDALKAVDDDQVRPIGETDTVILRTWAKEDDL